MQKITIILYILLGYTLIASAQGVGINEDNSTADPSAILDAKSTTKGVLHPRMTEAERDAISAPATGLLIFQTDGIMGLYYYSGAAWTPAHTGTVLGFCPARFTDARDNEVYAVVEIGNQCWMAENLRYNASGSYLNSANPSTTYGRLYDWATVMNGATTSASNPSGVQGICPSGWHLPSDAEWNELEIALGMPAVVAANTLWRGTDHGDKMRSAIEWSSMSGLSGNGNNASRFNAFPAGFYYTDTGIFGTLGVKTMFWSSTEDSPTHAWGRYLHRVLGGVYREAYDKTWGFSCRCIKD